MCRWGAIFASAPADKSPTFLVAALKDPIGANLDRVQIVKGWIDAAGERQERVYDVAVSDGREIGKDGRCKTPVGNSVDIANATWSNSIGDTETRPRSGRIPTSIQRYSAFYYVRVLEIPTPRWTAYDAKYFELKQDKEIPMTTSGAGLHFADLVHSVDQHHLGTVAYSQSLMTPIHLQGHTGDTAETANEIARRCKVQICGDLPFREIRIRLQSRLRHREGYTLDQSLVTQRAIKLSGKSTHVAGQNQAA